jgi:hypothetical protein
MASIYYNDSRDGIHFLDTVTGVTNLLVTADREFHDIALTPNGILYGASYFSGQIYSIDTATGVTTLVGDMGSSINSLASDANNNLYAVHGSQLVKMTPDGTVATLGDIGRADGDIVIVGDTVYMSNTSDKLVAFDLTTNQATTIGDVPHNSFGLSVGDNGMLLAFDDNAKVYEIDPATGTFTYTGIDIAESGTLLGATNAPALDYPLIMTDDFEAIAGAVDDWNYVAPPAGWYTDNASGKIEIGTQTEYGIEGGLATNKVIEIEAATGDDNLYTFIGSQADANVTIAFDHAQRPGFDSSITVLVDGVEVGVVNPQTNVFANQSFTLAGTGEVMRIEFKSTDANGKGVLLDNINILQAFNNLDPIANDDDAIAAQNTALVIAAADLLANDEDPEGGEIFTFSVGNAVNGTVAYNQLTDEVTFTPAAGYVGNASFTYSMVDNIGGKDTATVNLVVEPSTVVVGPTAIDDTVEASSAAQIVISPADLLANDSAFASASLGEATNGTVIYDGTNVIFTPTAGYDGPASFEYSLFDAQGVSSTATVNLTIVAPAENPVIEGTSSDDVLQGTDANETIFSGAGNDLMIGENGSDTFAWNLDDITIGGPVATDTIIADFSDRLDLSDLLQGEETIVADSTAKALDNYLDFSVTAEGSTLIQVNANGDTLNALSHNIEITGYDATAGNTLSDVQIISNLINSGHLITDLG